MQINNNFQKNANISMVAQLLWKSPGISRVEIARQLELYRSTVSNIINTLIDNGIVFEEREGDSMPQGGRKPICLGLNERFGCVVGLELQPAGYHAVIVNVHGAVLYSEEGELPSSPFPELLEFVLDGLEGPLRETGSPLLCICVGMPGIIDYATGVVVRSDPFRLQNAKFTERLSARYHVPVMFENDARCLAWMELAQRRGDNIRNFVCVNAEYQSMSERYGDRNGMSVGLGVAFAGRVFSGSRNAAGEFVSVSWRDASKGQTGLPDTSMDRLRDDTVAFADWVVDLFSSLVPVVSALDPEAVFAHGELARRSSEVTLVLRNRAPQFLSLLERLACPLTFGNGSSFSVATGAAMMFFQHLFSAPGCDIPEGQETVDWEAVFALSAKGIRT